MQFSVDDLPQPLLLLYGYWQKKNKNGCLPGRKDIDPVDMRQFLAHTALIDIVGDATSPKFRFRLVGTHIVDVHGSELTGQFIDELDIGDSWHDALALCHYTTENGKPAFQTGEYLRKHDDARFGFERLMLPLAGDGRSVDMLLVGANLTRLPNNR